MTYLDEAQVEVVTVDYFRELGYEYIPGPTIAPDLPDRQAGGEAPARVEQRCLLLALRPGDTLPPEFLSREIELFEAEEVA